MSAGLQEHRAHRPDVGPRSECVNVHQWFNAVANNDIRIGPSSEEFLQLLGRAAGRSELTQQRRGFSCRGGIRNVEQRRRLPIR